MPNVELTKDYDERRRRGLIVSHKAGTTVSLSAAAAEDAVAKGAGAITADLSPAKAAKPKE